MLGALGGRPPEGRLVGRDACIDGWLAGRDGGMAGGNRHRSIDSQTSNQLSLSRGRWGEMAKAAQELRYIIYQDNILHQYDNNGLINRAGPAAGGGRWPRRRRS